MTTQRGRPMPTDFAAIAKHNGVQALQIHFRASYHNVITWLGQLTVAQQEERRICVPLGRKGGQVAIVRDDTHNINASDRMARQSAESSTRALEAKYIAAAQRNGWAVREYRGAKA